MLPLWRLLCYPHAGFSVTVAEYLDTVRIWWDLWEMKLDTSKIKTMIASRTRTIHPHLTPINDRQNCAEGVWWPWHTLGVTFDYNKIFEKHLHLLSRADSQRFGFLRKSWRELQDKSLLGRCCQDFVLPVLEYNSAAWCLAADTHLKLLNRVVSNLGCMA